METTALYAGSFDPITYGHMWVVEQGMKIFDKVIVAIGINPNKEPTFSVDQRRQMLSRALELETQRSNFEVTFLGDQYLVKYAKSVGAGFILRGIRSAGDYEYERGARYINHDLEPYINTVFLIPPRHLSEVSSSLVRGMIGYDGWQKEIKRYVPEAAYDLIMKTYDK